jgi:transposase
MILSTNTTASNLPALTCVLGIDVAKDTLVATLLDAHTRKPRWHKEVPNNAKGWNELLRCAPAEAPWIVEPTGRYSHDVARAARKKGRDVRLAPPKKAQMFLKSVQSRAKTDKLDATGLALYGASCSLAPYPLKSPMQDKLDQLLCARKGLSLSVCRLEAQKRELPHASEALTAAIVALKAQIKAVDLEVKALCRTPELAVIQELQKVPGIGPVVATTIASRLSGRSFERADQFVAYCGLDVRVRQSGKKSGQIGLSKQGEAELRRVLYMAAMASVKAKDSPFAAQYEREKAKGLSATAALCSVARKMARLCWSLITHGTTYNPDRIYKHPSE